MNNVYSMTYNLSKHKKTYICSEQFLYTCARSRRGVSKILFRELHMNISRGSIFGQCCFIQWFCAQCTKKRGCLTTTNESNSNEWIVVVLSNLSHMIIHPRVSDTHFVLPSLYLMQFVLFMPSTKFLILLNSGKALDYRWIRAQLRGCTYVMNLLLLWKQCFLPFIDPVLDKRFGNIISSSSAIWYNISGKHSGLLTLIIGKTKLLKKHWNCRLF